MEAVQGHQVLGKPMSEIPHAQSKLLRVQGFSEPLHRAESVKRKALHMQRF